LEERVIGSTRVTGPLAIAALGIWAALVYLAPSDAAQGLIQKIFYVHVPTVAPTYLGFILTAVGGLGFLASRQEQWDRLALSGAEVGVVFCTLILVSGPIWAKPAWGVWWVWDLRLTSTLVLWFIYVAYLFLRAFAAGNDSARTFASIYGIAGTLCIPFVYYAVDLAGGSTLHPSNPAREGLPPGMARAIIAGLAAFLVVFAWLVATRLGNACLEAEIEERDWESAP